MCFYVECSSLRTPSCLVRNSSCCSRSSRVLFPEPLFIWCFFFVFVLRARARRCTDRSERVRRATRVMALIVGCRQLSRFLRVACVAPDEYVRNPKSEHQQLTVSCFLALAHYALDFHARFTRQHNSKSFGLLCFLELVRNTRNQARLPFSRFRHALTTRPNERCELGRFSNRFESQEDGAQSLGDLHCSACIVAGPRERRSAA